MSKMAEYVRIFSTGVTDDLVEKRQAAAAALEPWLKALPPARAVEVGAALAASNPGESPLPDEVADEGERAIQGEASSFLRSIDEGELQVVIIMAVAALELLAKAPHGSGWTAPDALAASLWSALTFQQPLEKAKLEHLRQDLISSNRVLAVAETSRERRPVPQVGRVNISQDSAEGAKVNNAFSRAVEPMMAALCENAALDREELDFLWWLLSDRSELISEPLASMPPGSRAVVAGLDAAAKLGKLPGDAHRHIVLRNIKDEQPLSLQELIQELGERRNKLAERIGDPPLNAAAAFPLIVAIASGRAEGSSADEKRTPQEWGGRALLEGAIHHLQQSG